MKCLSGLNFHGWNTKPCAKSAKKIKEWSYCHLQWCLLFLLVLIISMRYVDKDNSRLRACRIPWLDDIRTHTWVKSSSQNFTGQFFTLVKQIQSQCDLLQIQLQNCQSCQKSAGTLNLCDDSTNCPRAINGATVTSLVSKPFGGVDKEQWSSVHLSCKIAQKAPQDKLVQLCWGRKKANTVHFQLKYFMMHDFGKKPKWQLKWKFALSVRPKIQWSYLKAFNQVLESVLQSALAGHVISLSWTDKHYKSTHKSKMWRPLEIHVFGYCFAFVEAFKEPFGRLNTTLPNTSDGGWTFLSVSVIVLDFFALVTWCEQVQVAAFSSRFRPSRRKLTAALSASQEEIHPATFRTQRQQQTQL